MLGKKNDLHGAGQTPEDNMKWLVINQLSRDLYDQSLYFESARRVIFKNCMAANELDHAQIPNFNKNFYYNQKDEQSKLQECYNTRMQLHFGDEQAKKHHLYMDFEAMKREYQNYEKWHPQSRIVSQYMRGETEEQINSLVGKLAQKSTSGKYDFQ